MRTCLPVIDRYTCVRSLRCGLAAQLESVSIRTGARGHVL